jgi:hypothetical protein
MVQQLNAVAVDPHAGPMHHRARRRIHRRLVGARRGKRITAEALQRIKGNPWRRPVPNG